MQEYINTCAYEMAELRVSVADKKRTLSGYAAVFNRMSKNLGGFKENIARGAFTNALKKSDARALVNHNRDMVLGRQSAGTLRLREDTTGLFMEVDLPNTSYANDLLESVRLGNIREQSFGFTVQKDEWKNLEKPEETTRTIVEIGELFEVSPVAFPAYPDSNIQHALRALEGAKKEIKEAQEWEARQIEQLEALLKNIKEGNLADPDDLIRAITYLQGVEKRFNRQKPDNSPPPVSAPGDAKQKRASQEDVTQLFNEISTLIGGFKQ